MIGLDTNVLVRYLTQDHPEQSRLATVAVESLTPERPGFLSLPVLVETYWVLRRAYHVPWERTRSILLDLLDAAELRVQAADTVRAALLRSAPTAEFPDALIAELADAHGSEATLTFDRVAAEQLGLRLLTG